MRDRIRFKQVKKNCFIKPKKLYNELAVEFV